MDLDVSRGDWPSEKGGEDRGGRSGDGRSGGSGTSGGSGSSGGSDTSGGSGAPTSTSGGSRCVPHPTGNICQENNRNDDFQYAIGIHYWIAISVKIDKRNQERLVTVPSE